MPQKKPTAPFEVVDALLAAYGTNSRINEYMIRNLPREAWRAMTPDGKGRNIASIVAHMHNVRLMWLKAAQGFEELSKLEGDDFTPDDAIEALRASYQPMRDLIAGSLNGDGRIKGFKPDVASFLGYLIAHEAHHRGQISMLARQSGHPLPKSAMFGMWEWGRR
jgi:uncharacterized damage-inducible protein DinB